MSKIQIQKVDHAEEPPKVAGRHKSMKTFPRGVMKGSRTRKGGSDIVGVKDPARPPPSRKGTLRILTDKGAKLRRKTIKQNVQSMSDGKVRDVLKKSNISVNPKTPPHIAREILEGGMEAGMIVVK